MRIECRFAVGLLAVIILASIYASCTNAQEVQWGRLLGTTFANSGSGVDTDISGNVYVTGSSIGDLNGQTSNFGTEAFITKYNPAGVHQWTRLLGTFLHESGSGVSVDGVGNVYVSGYTDGDLQGEVNAGKYDAFVSKFDTAGVHQWTHLSGSSQEDFGYDIAADGLGNLFIAGSTDGNLHGEINAGSTDMFVSNYNAAGVRQWTRLLGTADFDEGFAVSADGLGNVYISGYTYGNLDGQTNAGGADAYVSKYNSAGVRQWTRLLGTSSTELAFGVSADSLGNVFVTGRAGGNLNGQTNAGGVDAFVSKYDAAGVIQWTRLLGTAAEDRGLNASADGLGNVFITGHTQGSLDGQPNAGNQDAFVIKLNSAGVTQWTRLLGSIAEDVGAALSADGSGNVVVAGYTKGNLFSQTNSGDYDAFVARISDLLPGDYNRNGVVDSADYVLWRRKLNSSVPNFTSADGNGDGLVNQDDFNLWRANFGNMAGAGAQAGGTQFVPEPTFWTYVLVVSLSLISRRANGKQISA